VYLTPSAGLQTTQCVRYSNLLESDTLNCFVTLLQYCQRTNYNVWPAVCTSVSLPHLYLPVLLFSGFSLSQFCI